MCANLPAKGDASSCWCSGSALIWFSDILRRSKSWQIMTSPSSSDIYVCFTELSWTGMMQHDVLSKSWKDQEWNQLFQSVSFVSVYLFVPRSMKQEIKICTTNNRLICSAAVKRHCFFLSLVCAVSVLFFLSSSSLILSSFIPAGSHNLSVCSRFNLFTF